MRIPELNLLCVGRLGQKTEKYYETKVEYYAPYLLKDGMVQRMIKYDGNTEEAEEVKSYVKFRNRADKLIAKVMEKLENRLTEKFDMGRPDRLEELLYINHMASHATGEQIKLYKFYHKSRKDGLSTRESRDWGGSSWSRQYYWRPNKMCSLFYRDKGHLRWARGLSGLCVCQLWNS